MAKDHHIITLTYSDPAQALEYVNRSDSESIYILLVNELAEALELRGQCEGHVHPWQIQPISMVGPQWAEGVEREIYLLFMPVEYYSKKILLERVLREANLI